MTTHRLTLHPHEVAAFRDGSATAIVRPCVPQPGDKATFYHTHGAIYLAGGDSIPCPFGVPGDVLKLLTPSEVMDADPDADISIIRRTVADVRCVRVGDLTHEQIMATGYVDEFDADGPAWAPSLDNQKRPLERDSFGPLVQCGSGVCGSSSEAFGLVWDATYGDEPALRVEANPWVFVAEVTT